ncbi:transglycosylase [Salmonella enterica]|uniref:Transglycosylase n=1 Tax=Salmonella enterica TaxID=28901 RepID=A0A5U6CKD4_SALER|nr:transglycosylase [Salmonella enterica]ECI3247507.1 transglycosylase [Salmonella enterica subsp. enterica serovar 4,[5],12:i:-]EHU1080466.1 transglycosylase [Salmonella enterica subsp. enterica serovar Reading]EAS2569362.1 transglycosylase [Salmonella enterica]EAS3805378.1 transglycosylase [Salmonella enterica]
MKENKDRIAIIDAIQSASSDELEALAEIKKAIMSNIVVSNNDNSPQGKVSRRLSRTQNNRQSKTGSNSARDQQNVYEERLPPKKKPLRMTTASSSAVVTDYPQRKERRNNTDKRTATVPLISQSPASSPKKRAHRQAGAVQTENPEQSPSPREKSASPTLRDSNGRFVSQQKNEDIARRKERQQEQDAEAKLQAGFFRKLGSIMGADSGGPSSEDSLTDAAGVGAGGPLWMAARGVFDISKEITGKAVSLKEWVGKFEDDGANNRVATKKTAITYPAPGEHKASATAFSGAVEAKSTRAVEEQTKILEGNDSKIIDGLEDVTDEIVKLRKSVSSGGNFRLSDLWRNRSVRRNKINIGGESRTRRNKGRKKSAKAGKLLSAGEKAAAGTAAVAGGGAAIKAGKDVAVKTGEKVALNTGKKAAAGTATVAGGGAAIKAGKDVAVKTGEEVALNTGKKAAEKKIGAVALKDTAKLGIKSAASMGARAIPIIGSLAMAGYDAVDGYNDTEAQKAAFGLSDQQKVSTQQKSAYAAANVLDMGGIVSGATNLIGQGISALGFQRAGESLKNFETADIARGVNGAIDITKSAFNGVTGAVKDAFLSTDDSTKQVKKAVEDGTRKTVDAINSLKQQLQGGINGEDGVGVYGYTSPSEFNAPAVNTITDDLNIGGSNAQNRNYRNHNLGNLVFANQEGATLETPNAKGEQRFARFNTPEEGIRALANQVSSYYNGTSRAAGYQKLQTVSSIISKWAPANENNTNQYIDNVSKYLGVSPTDKIDVSNPEVMTHLVRAIATKEGGNPAVRDEFIKTALGTFNASTGRWEGQFNDETLAKLNKIQKENGGQLIARNSQYSVGNKVKYANGNTPAVPVNKAIPIKSAETFEVAQHAQAAKKMAENTPTASEHQKTDGNSESMLHSLLESSHEAIAEVEGMFGGAGSFIGDNFQLTKEFASAQSAGGIEALVEKARRMDQAMTAKVSSITGKSFGFQPAKQVAAIQQALQQKRTPPAAASDVNLLETSKDNAVYNNGYRVVEGEDKGFLGSLLDSSATGLTRIGAAVLPTVGDSLSRLVGGLDGAGLVNDLVYQATGQNTNIARAISPLTKATGSWLNGGINQVANTIKGVSGDLNTLAFGSASAIQEPFLAMPPQLPTVTDLARSGVRQTLNTDTVNNDPAMLKVLDNVYSILKDILNVNKNNAKGDPDKVVKTAQPQPRQRASTVINDPSLDALLED